MDFSSSFMDALTSYTFSAWSKGTGQDLQSTYSRSKTSNPGKAL
jgi:hypothetical protein